LATAYISMCSVGAGICKLPSTSPSLRNKFDDCDQRKMFNILTKLSSSNTWMRSHVFGCHSHLKTSRGVQFLQVPEDFAKFDTELFLRVRNLFLAEVQLYCLFLFTQDIQESPSDIPLHNTCSCGYPCTSP
jgi:hypothetical protein